MAYPKNYQEGVKNIEYCVIVLSKYTQKSSRKPYIFVKPIWFYMKHKKLKGKQSKKLQSFLQRQTHG